MGWNKVKIRSDPWHWALVVEIDGKELHGVDDVRIDASAGWPITVTLKMKGTEVEIEEVEKP